MNSQTTKWYVVYTMPKSEKKVVSFAAGIGIESYLPLHQVIRQWSDRKKRLEVPLFPNYVFVKVDDVTKTKLFSIKQVVRYVSIQQRPVVVRDSEINTIKRLLKGDFEIRMENYFPRGARVKINYGQFAGVEGVVAKENKGSRLIVTVDSLMKAFSINLPSHNAQLI